MAHPQLAAGRRQVLAEAAGELGSGDGRELGPEPFGTGDGRAEPQAERVLVRDLAPVGEGAPGARIGEHVAGEVGRFRVKQPGRVHDGTQSGRAGEHVAEPVGDHGGRGLKQQKYLKDLGTYVTRWRLAVMGPGASPASDLGEVGKVTALGDVKRERVGDGADDGPGWVAVPALLNPGQVLNADPSADREFGPAQSWRPAPRPVLDPDVRRPRPVTFRADELSQRRAHAAKSMSAPCRATALRVALWGPA